MAALHFFFPPIGSLSGKLSYIVHCLHKAIDSPTSLACCLLHRFKAAPWGPSEASQGWGWRLVAFPAQGQDHAQALLLKSIHDTNIRRVLKKRDKKGDTLLHLAAWENNLNAIDYLVEGGADIKAIDSTRTRVTPLHLAAMAGHLPAVKR